MSYGKLLYVCISSSHYSSSDDVDVLVPEVARLQELTASLNSVIREKTEEYELLQEEVERLKKQYSTSQSAATALQVMEKNLSDEMAKDKDLIAKLKAELETRRPLYQS